MQLEAITWQRMAERLAGHLDDRDTPSEQAVRQRVGIDGAPAADTGVLAGHLADALRERGRAALAVPAAGFLRPASLRFEFGREDVDAYLDGWYDTAALWREVFGPTDPGGSGRVLPDLWDPVTDRATRSPYAELPPDGVLIVHGPLLLGHWFPFDLAVHVRLSPGALARRTEPADRWTLPAFARYETETAPADRADVLVRADDPRHPAWTGLPG
ncbi:uridine kinase [Streptomyces goshikiensis]|uniref:Uridine kinase n=1 Tax=Streptomyces goshikiensis TaxID=1942 RepID=A0ABZ1RR46_9ACTN|nr:MULTISPECIES: uridine kinase [Streptomyces]AKL65683.1 uridine kinase [Streptomyces sp. Mg1]MBP0933760.1 uridine kinase [Streptomyces sp. KCTC 0041BP]RPK53859.1 uridine kinase [Streptomyces sp. ADI91-18]WBY19684.1 uridine kinase [Streptomyces goshikiensis]WSR98466.1 uridine kinase [Streptomyces goshikiensis]